jgi:hypothetical protein
MKRYISNYTILGNGYEVINHITTVGDDAQLISILPFDRELGNTIYVPKPLCVAATSDINVVEKVFHECASRQQLRQQLSKLEISRPQAGTPVTVLRLDFSTNTLKPL